MHLTLEVEQEADGRCLAAATDLPGVGYDTTEGEALARVQTLTLRIPDRFLEFARARRCGGMSE